MAKRKKKDIVLATASKEELAWLRQPLNFALWRGEASSVEVKIMMGITRALQDKITRLWFQRDQQGKALSLFDNEDFDQDGELEFRIKFSETGVPADQYWKLTPEFMEKMMLFHYPSNEGGSVGYRQLFNFVGTTFDKDVKYSRKNELTFKIGRKTVDYVFDMTQTHRFLESVVNNCKNIYSARLYIILTAKASLGKWDVKLDDLRGILLSQGKASGRKQTDQKKEVGQVVEEIVEKYTTYKDFRNYVLRKAHDELKDLAERNLIDIYFEYTEIYPEGKKRGTPESIHFDIITTELGEEEVKRKKEVQLRIRLERDLVETFGISMIQSQKLITMLSSENLDCFIEQQKALAEEIKEKKNLNNREAYSYTRLEKIVNNLLPIAEELNAGEQSQTQTKVQPFAPDEKGTQTDPSAFLSDEEKLQWQKVVEGALQYFESERERNVLNTFLEGTIRQIKFVENTVHIIFDNLGHCNWFDEKYSKIYK